MYEQTSMISTSQAEAKPAARYYEINEDTARNAHYCVHMSDYQPGSATNGYRAAVDEAAALVEARKSKVSPYYHDKLDALLDRYARRLAQWTNDYNRNQASYPSQFISGAGNYNMKKHEKQMSREDTLWKEYDEIKAILNKIEAVGTGAVDLADPHAREMLTDQLQKLQSKLDESKALNAYYRKHKSFVGFPGLTAEAAAKLTADFADTCQRCPWVKHPIPGYELTSLRGKIKRVQARLDELDKRTEQAEQPAESTKFSGGEIVRNLEADRLQILFDEKPDEETRAALKQNGFRWSPRYSAWQRQLTQNAEIAARRALGLTEYQNRPASYQQVKRPPRRSRGQKGHNMNSYPNIMYFFHDGSTYLVPRYTNVSGLAVMLDEARRAAYLDMTKSGADHAVYAVKHYDPKTGDVVKADIYAPAVLLNEAEFTKRTDAQMHESPGCYILALHARK